MKKGESQNNFKYRYGILYLRGWMRVTANQKFLGKHIYIKKLSAVEIEIQRNSLETFRF